MQQKLVTSNKNHTSLTVFLLSSFLWCYTIHCNPKISNASWMWEKGLNKWEKSNKQWGNYLTCLS